ncbi:glycosyltransferase [Marinoscillum pacificum]|uniref:glycosyltransferase n=1 Tax=Marinoscillum pacificum TaxID=392723 RepID=UPI0021577199|nr:glycosyltransferase [Marinoscillum pacificum]
MPKYSIVIPVYNRPDEVDELLETLTSQTFKDFEVVIVEDGSTVDCKDVISKYASRLDIQYFVKENGGQGFARNYGYERAIGEYFIVFDSDCLIPPHYLASVDAFLIQNNVDAYGGPDAAHESFTVTQKAINHVMTSFFTTGGIRGNKKHIGTYHPRSFNMGISRAVWEQTKGYIIPFMGEDMEFSTRILKEGFKTALIPDAFVYHKRRTSLTKFYKQLKYFGRARINLSRFHKGQVGVVHLFPTVFSLGLILSLLLSAAQLLLGYFGAMCYLAYFTLIFLEALLKTKSIKVGVLSPLVAFLQLFGYGYGLIYEWFRKLRGINPNTKYIELY